MPIIHEASTHKMANNAASMRIDEANAMCWRRGGGVSWQGTIGFERLQIAGEDVFGNRRRVPLKILAVVSNGESSQLDESRSRAPRRLVSRRSVFRQPRPRSESNFAAFVWCPSILSLPSHVRRSPLRAPRLPHWYATLSLEHDHAFPANVRPC